jgi:hypothetical protein
MAADNPITYEEFLDNYEFKIVKKMLLREYPWIKDVFMKDPEEINKYNLIFVDVQIDPYELERLMGWRIAWYVTTRIKQGEGFWSPYLATFLKDPTDADQARQLAMKMNEDMEAVHKSPALPEDLRLPGTRKIQIGSFYTSPDTTIPEDTEPYPGHQI